MVFSPFVWKDPREAAVPVRLQVFDQLFLGQQFPEG
jgi:hypothetical protein